MGHLPRGLFESQLKNYFEQFGKVLRLRLSRSKKVKTSTVPQHYLVVSAQTENELRCHTGLRSDN